MAQTKRYSTIKCSFCGKSASAVDKLITGPSVYICNECVDLCRDIISRDMDEPASVKADNLPIPKEINVFLDTTWFIKN